MLAWSQDQLAKAAGVSRATLAEFEGGRRQPIANNIAAICQALVDGGVVFEADGETVVGGPGVRLFERTSA